MNVHHMYVCVCLLKLEAPYKTKTSLETYIILHKVYQFTYSTYVKYIAQLTNTTCTPHTPHAALSLGILQVETVKNN